MLHPSHGWIGTHRLPLESAIFYCKQYRQQNFDCPVTMVPDGQDPAPYMAFALEFTPTFKGVHFLRHDKFVAQVVSALA